MKVLFITEKFHSAPNYGLTNNIYNLIGSYVCSGYGTYEHCFIDPSEIWSTEGVDRELLTREYDAAIVSVYHYLPSRSVAQQFGHKMAYCWWDSCISRGGVRGWSDIVHQLCFDWGKGEEEKNVFCVEVPQDEKYFYKDDNVVEDIDVSFVGSIDTPRSDRAVTIQKIRDAGINIWAGGGRGPGLTNLSIQEYTDMFRRSKICLNLGFGHGMPQRKSRVFEIAACGQYMMTNQQQMLSGKDGQWFVDGEDYVSFADDNDLIIKLQYYLDRPEERKRMSDNAYKRYKENYDPKCFWKKILGICGIQV